MNLISLKTELRQELKLTPQLLQSMEVLQMNSQELLDYLGKISEENPTLELSEASELRSAYAELRQKASWLDAGTFGTSFAHEEDAPPEPGATDKELDSLSAFQPVPYITTYAATKAFVLSYSRAMNRELKAKGIRVMAMNPGWVKTEFFNHAFQTNADNEVRYFNRLYEAKDVVKTGLNDLYHSKKDCSIHGFPVKFQVFLVKLLPHSLVMNTWLNQQKKAKNNKGLTTK